MCSGSSLNSGHELISSLLHFVSQRSGWCGAQLSKDVFTVYSSFIKFGALNHPRIYSGCLCLISKLILKQICKTLRNRERGLFHSTVSVPQTGKTSVTRIIQQGNKHSPHREPEARSLGLKSSGLYTHHIPASPTDSVCFMNYILCFVGSKTCQIKHVGSVQVSPSPTAAVSSTLHRGLHTNSLVSEAS